MLTGCVLPIWGNTKSGTRTRRTSIPVVDSRIVIKAILRFTVSKKGEGRPSEDLYGHSRGYVLKALCVVKAGTLVTP